MAPLVSVVIVTWNSASCIADCLISLRTHAPSVPHEVVLVDNGSHDGTVEVARAAYPDLIVIANPDNRGLAAANNQGMAHAHGDYLLISNPDVLYREGTVDELLAAADRHPKAGFVISRLVYADGRPQTSVGDMPTLREALLGRRVVRRIARKGDRTGVWWDGWDHDEELEVGHGMECCYLVRREALDTIGPQDERYRLDWEGLDWTRRAHESGWEIWFAPRAEAVHLGGVSIKQALPRWVVSSHRGMYYYFAARTPLLLRPLLALLFSLRAAVKLVGTLGRERIYTVGNEPD